MITLLAKIMVVEGRESDFEVRFTALAARVLAAEPGTLVYKLAKSRKVANEYHLVEFYQDANAMTAHMANLKGEPMMAGIGELMVGRAEVTILDDVTA